MADARIQQFKFERISLGTPEAVADTLLQQNAVGRRPWVIQQTLHQECFRPVTGRALSLQQSLNLGQTGFAPQQLSGTAEIVLDPGMVQAHGHGRLAEADHQVVLPLLAAELHLPCTGLVERKIHACPEHLRGVTRVAAQLLQSGLASPRSQRTSLLQDRREPGQHHQGKSSTSEPKGCSSTPVI